MKNIDRTSKCSPYLWSRHNEKISGFDPQTRSELKTGQPEASKEFEKQSQHARQMNSEKIENFKKASSLFLEAKMFMVKFRVS